MLGPYRMLKLMTSNLSEEKTTPENTLIQSVRSGWVYLHTTALFSNKSKKKSPVFTYVMPTPGNIFFAAKFIYHVKFDH